MDRSAGTGGTPRGDRVEVTRRSIAAFDPVTPREVRSRDRILFELDHLARPFDKEANPVHITGSAIVIGSRGTVLHRHKRLGIWIQPGGHVEGDEEPAETALRETREETGLPVRHPADAPVLIHLDAHPANGHFHLDIRYLVVSPDVDPRPPAGESQEVVWFSLDKAIAIADAALVDGLKRVASGPLSDWTESTASAVAARSGGDRGLCANPGQPTER